MKKILALLLSLTMVFLVACSGGDKHLATATIESNQVSYEIKYYGNGDKVNKMEQKTVVKDLTPEQKKQVETELEKVKETYSKIKGVEYKSELKDTTVTENLTMNVGNKETLKALVDQKLLPVEDKNIQIVSLEKSLKALEASGWKVTKTK